MCCEQDLDQTTPAAIHTVHHLSRLFVGVAAGSLRNDHPGFYSAISLSVLAPKAAGVPVNGAETFLY